MKKQHAGHQDDGRPVQVLHGRNEGLEGHGNDYPDDAENDKNFSFR